MAVDRNQIERLLELVRQNEPDLLPALYAFAESEPFYRRFVTNGPFGMAVLDQELSIIQSNPRFSAILGYTETELLGRTILSLICRDDRGVASDRLFRVTRYWQHTHSFELRFVCNDTKVRRLRLTVSHADPDELNSVYLYAMLEDIEEQKALAHQHAHIIASAKCLLWHAIVRETGNETYLHWEINYPPLEATQQFLRLDIPDGSFYAQEFYLCRPQEDRDRCDHKALTAFRAGESYDQEFHIRAADGSLHWMHEFVQVETIEPGRTWRAVGTCIDITDRKRMEETLRESETRFHTLVDDLPILIWMLDTSNKPVLVNRAWCEFTGCPLQDAGMFDWLAALHPDDVDTASKAFADAYSTRKPYQAEYRMCRYDGQYRWLLSTGVPRFYADGTFVGYIGSSQDVTDLKALQEQLMEAQKLESLGRLAGGIAHDFNNLLTAIMGYTELALLSLPPEAEESAMLANVQAAAERAANLTRQLLMYARRQMVEFTNIDVNQVIVGTYDLLRRTIGAQYELVTLLTEETCCISSNTTQIEQVLLNLVVNARDAMPEGGRIIIETEVVVLNDEYAGRHIGVTPGEFVMFAVSDTGTGIPPDLRDRIFEPFFTTKEVGKGTGLGLATCYGIVKQSKGNIWVYSEPGIGTTFKIYLPRLRQMVAAEELQQQDSPQVGTETILLVDDEPLVRDAAARILRQHGYRVLEASNGPEALYIHGAWQGAIDLLLTDVVMPLMGGKELAQRLLEQRPELRVLYCSGYTQNAILQAGVLKPGILLLPKPFSATVLVRKVRETLGTL